MTFSDRLRDPIGLLIAGSGGLLIGVVLAVGGLRITAAILYGAGLAVVLFLVMMLVKRKPAPPKPHIPVGPTEAPEQAEASDSAEVSDSAGPVDKAVATWRRFANSYADIIATSSVVRHPDYAREVASLVTVAGEVVDLVGQHAATVATDERTGTQTGDRTHLELDSLEPAWDWLTSAADALKQGRFHALDRHVQDLRGTRTALREGIRQHVESRKKGR